MLDVHCYLGSTTFDAGRSFHVVTLVEVGIWRWECPKEFPVKFPYHACMVYLLVLSWFLWYSCRWIPVPWMLWCWFGRSFEKTRWAFFDWRHVAICFRCPYFPLKTNSFAGEVQYLESTWHSPYSVVDIGPLLTYHFGICAHKVYDKADVRWDAEGFGRCFSFYRWRVAEKPMGFVYLPRHEWSMVVWVVVSNIF